MDYGELICGKGVSEGWGAEASYSFVLVLTIEKGIA